jgi:excisionase family DNA binding protein
LTRYCDYNQIHHFMMIKSSPMSHPASGDTEDPVLTTAAAARLLGVAVSTTQLWLESGALPSWKTPGGHRRIRLSAVMALLNAQAQARDRQPAARSAPAATPAPARPAADEGARMAAVQASGLLDTPPENVFDRLTRLAALATDCPIALITLLTSDRQWFKSRIGMALSETPRGWAFCNHAILGEAPFMVEDATRDPRFAGNPLVTGEARIRFYGGIPLRDAGGHALGTLCVMDREPRRLRARELQSLEELAAIAAEELARRVPTTDVS